MEGRLFEDLVVSRVGPRRVRAGGLPLSFVLHAAGLAGLLALSMVATEELPTPPVVRIPMPGPRTAGATTTAPPVSSPRRTPTPRSASATRLFVDTEAPLPIEAQPFAPDDESTIGCTGCVVGAETPSGGGGDDGSVGDPMGDTPPRGSSVPPVRVGGHIQPPRKVRHLDPPYPDLARRAGIEGVVILECVIDPNGLVRSVQVLRGHPLLNAAAAETVRQWVYSPTLLNGVPVAIIMTVTVRFTTR